jgi:hypothetical protein
MPRRGYSPPSFSPPPSPNDEWGAQRWSSPESTIPSPGQQRFYDENRIMSQEDLPSPIQPEEDSFEGTPTFELVYHNDAERAEQERQREAHNQQQEQMYGMAYHVHNVFENIKDNYEKIIEALGGRIQLELLPMVGPNELIAGLDSLFATIIMRKYGTPFKEGAEYFKVNKILDKLWRAKREFLGDHIRNEIFTWIQFVIRQPDSFQFEYIDCFINDTFFAYDGIGDNISCPKGISERLLLSIADACILYCIQYKKKNKKKTKRTEKKKKAKTKKKEKLLTAARRDITVNQRPTSAPNQRPASAPNQRPIAGGMKSEFVKCDNLTYRKLIHLFKKEVPDMNELTKEWSVIFTGTLADTMTTAQIKQEFIDFMERKYKLYGLNYSAAINRRADEFDEIFERREF